MDLKIPAGLSGSGATAFEPAGKAALKPGKLHDAAQQFESLMINEMMKSVKESSSSGWLGSEGEGDSAGESAMEMAQAQFASALAKSGGLGLTRMIEKSISAQTAHAPTTAAQ